MLNDATVRGALLFAVIHLVNQAEIATLTLQGNDSVDVAGDKFKDLRDPDIVWLPVIAKELLRTEVASPLEGIEFEDLSEEYVEHLRDKMRKKVFPVLEGLDPVLFTRVKNILIDEGSLCLNRSSLLY